MGRLAIGWSFRLLPAVSGQRGFASGTERLNAAKS
jgi:hypothetical protein